MNSILPPDVRGWRVGGQERLVVAGLEARDVASLAERSAATSGVAISILGELIVYFTTVLVNPRRRSRDHLYTSEVTTRANASERAFLQLMWPASNLECTNASHASTDVEQRYLRNKERILRARNYRAGDLRNHLFHQERHTQSKAFIELKDCTRLLCSLGVVREELQAESNAATPALRRKRCSTHG